VTSPASPFSFDLAAATKHLTATDERLARLIEETLPFQIDLEDSQSPYEALLESIAYQSISGKAAATIFGRVKALSSGAIPKPQKMLKLRKSALRKAGLSGAKIVAMKDLAQKTIDGVVPTLGQAEKMSDEKLVERLVSVRGIGAWTVDCGTFAATFLKRAKAGSASSVPAFRSRRQTANPRQPGRCLS